MNLPRSAIHSQEAISLFHNARLAAAARRKAPEIPLFRQRPSPSPLEPRAPVSGVPDAPHGFQSAVPTAERGQPEISFPARPKTRAGRSDQPEARQQRFKKGPGIHITRRFQPDIPDNGGHNRSEDLYCPRNRFLPYL